MSSNVRALIFSYSDCLYYYAGTTQEPKGCSAAVNFLKDANGKMQKFPSLYRAKLALINLGFAQGWLIMQSAYDEMIGNEPAQKAELFMPFTKDSPH
ncbi:MAG TPA: DUF6482 family protein [Cellvibrio sp.]|nr:DUF6482 family protein [Cellvibrio sp.]